MIEVSCDHTHARASLLLLHCAKGATCAWFTKLPKKIWPHLLAASSEAMPMLRLIHENRAHTLKAHQ